MNRRDCWPLALVAWVALGCANLNVRFPDDVQAALSRDDMRRAETDALVLYYPATQRDEAARFLARAEQCAQTLRTKAHLRNRHWEKKMVIVMPDAPLNNAYVMPPLGTEDVSVIPVANTFDFSTELGMPPDPGFIGCHELAHYVHLRQMAGLWGALNHPWWNTTSPQIGFSSWVFEGMATYYEAMLTPAGRPRWPLFTGTFAAGLAGQPLRGDALSELGRVAPQGHQYLVGSMFVRFLMERFGEDKFWDWIARQGRSPWLMLGAGVRFRQAYGISLASAFGEFSRWRAREFPVRRRDAGQAVLRDIGSTARYARSISGTEAWVVDSLDRAPRLVIRDPLGALVYDRTLTDLMPPRAVIQGAASRVSGLSLTADGDVWLTVVDSGAYQQTTRLLLLAQGARRPRQIAKDLGPGLGVSPDGGTYYFAKVANGGWSLAAYDVASKQSRTLFNAPAGRYVLTAGVSPNGERLVASYWNGGAFDIVAFSLKGAGAGAMTRLVAGTPDTPVYDPSYINDDEVVFLATVQGRFQAARFAAGVVTPLTNAPYAVLAPRAVGTSLRFLNRQGWSWTLDEIAIDPTPVTPSTSSTPSTLAEIGSAPLEQAGVAEVAPRDVPPTPPPTNLYADYPYAWHDGLFRPQGWQLQADFLQHRYGTAVSGLDRLGRHQWWLTASYQPDTELLSYGGAYLNRQLAPWSIVLLATRDQYRYREVSSRDTGPGGRAQNVTTLQERRLNDVATAGVFRTWAGSIGLSLEGVYLREKTSGWFLDDADARVSYQSDVELGAGRLALAYRATDGSRYGGESRRFGLGGAVMYAPDSASSAGELTDTRMNLEVGVEFPALRRSSLLAKAIARQVVASADDAPGLLEIGGIGRGGTLYSHLDTASTDEAAPTLLPIGFSEYLRGYEDRTIATNRAFIGELAWTYPLILDRGLGYLNPVFTGFFFRQVDIEAFVSGAFDDEGRGRDSWHGAAGGALRLQLALARIPFLVEYQVSKRLADDAGILQMISLGI